MIDHYSVRLGGHRGFGCTDHDFYQDKRDIAALPVENTLASIKSAFAHGADYIETDAVMSKDGIIFTLHNVVPADHFFATQKPHDMLNKMNYAEIATYKTGRNHNGIITPIHDVLNYIATADRKTLPWAINIEIKGVQGSGQDYEDNYYLQNLVQTVHQSNLPADRILWSSFCLENIIRMSHALPMSRYGMLFSEKSDLAAIYADHQDDLRYSYMPFQAEHIDAVYQTWQTAAHPDAALQYVHPEILTVSPDTIRHIVQYGMGINSWALFETLNEDRQTVYQKAVQLAAQYNVPFTVITDYLDDMKNVFPR